jgi:hypothetical protein
LATVEKQIAAQLFGLRRMTLVAMLDEHRADARFEELDAGILRPRRGAGCDDENSA